MNKIFSFLLFFLPLLIFGQSNTSNPIIDQQEFRKVRFGFYTQGSLGWLNPEQQKIYSRGTLGFGSGWGFDLEINFNKNTSLRSGLNLSNFNAGLNYFDTDLNPNLDATYFALDQNEDFINWNEVLTNTKIPDTVVYQLYSRNYKINYLNIPLIIKFKTNEIGYFTYFGEFGGTLGFKTSASVDDEIKPFIYDTSSMGFNHILPNTNQKFIVKDINLDKGTQSIRVGLNMGLGAEYNLAGSTALFIQINYNYFLNNLLVKEENEIFLRKVDNNGAFKKVGVKAIPGSVVLSLGIIF